MIGDTSKEVKNKQIEILRRMSPSDRLTLALELTATSRKLLEQGVRSRHPEYTEDVIRLAVIRLLIPETLFNKAYPDAVGIKP